MGDCYADTDSDVDRDRNAKQYAERDRYVWYRYGDPNDYADRRNPYSDPDLYGDEDSYADCDDEPNPKHYDEPDHNAYTHRRAGAR